MIGKLRLWLVALVFFALLAAQLFGTDALRWYKDAGGPGSVGLVNLPCALAVNQQVVSIAREGYNMTDLGRGTVMNVPANMTGVVAVVTDTDGVHVGAGVVEGSITISGKDLLMLRDNGVAGFSMTVTDGEKYLRICFRFKVAENRYTIIVW